MKPITMPSNFYGRVARFVISRINRWRAKNGKVAGNCLLCALGQEQSALALSYFELCAPALGLGSCWGGYFYSAVNAYPPLYEGLGLPPDHKAFGAVMVGYPKLRYQRLPLRKQPRITWI